MTDLLPPTPQFLAFLAAATVLAVTPGPGVAYVVTRTLLQGRRAGLASVIGVGLGNFVNAAGASLGLAAVLAASPLVFTILRYAGAAYLCVLGVQALRAPNGGRAPDDPSNASPRVLRQGALVALLNPKTALFFAAFLPQFMSPAGSPIGQGLVLAGVFVAIAIASDAIWVLLAARVAPSLRTQGPAARWGRFAAAVVYFGLAACAISAQG